MQREHDGRPRPRLGPRTSERPPSSYGFGGGQVDVGIIFRSRRAWGGDHRDDLLNTSHHGAVVERRRAVGVLDGLGNLVAGSPHISASARGSASNIEGHLAKNDDR